MNKKSTISSDWNVHTMPCEFIIFCEIQEFSFSEQILPFSSCQMYMRPIASKTSSSHIMYDRKSNRSCSSVSSNESLTDDHDR